MLQLIDLAGVYFRAFHSQPASIVGPHGRPVNAIRGTLDILARVITDSRPRRFVACLDLDWRPAWRVDLLPSYKAHRVMAEVRGDGVDVEVVPDDLSPQVPILLDVLDAFGLTIGGAQGFEADDVIGTLASIESKDPVEVVTGDRDLFQLADDSPPEVTVRYLGAGMSKMKVYSAADIAAKYELPAGLYADFAALRGDPSDGLPGVTGVGDKTAAQLVSRFGTIEDIVAAAEDPKSGMAAGVRAKINLAHDYLAVAPKVVRVARDCAVVLSPAGKAVLPASPAEPGRVAELVKEHGIGSPVKRLMEAMALAAG